MKFSRLHVLNLAVGLLWVGSALAQPPSTGSQTPIPGGSPTGAPPDNRQNTNPSGTTQDQQMDPYMTDKDFVRNAAESSATELHLGKVAQEKASSDAAKELGKKMVEANTQLSEQLKQAAAALKVQLASDLPRKAKKAEDKLAKLSGPEFDRAYAKIAADEQKQAVKQFERETKDGKVTGLKEFATKNLPAEQERQKQAEELAAAPAQQK
jgi:putative membrane protein